MATLGHMNPYRSRTTTQGRNMAGARALWRATGMTDADFDKPIIAIANSFTQFVPGHVHLHDIGQRVKKVIDAAGGWGVEFNTIAIDDGIAMGHGGMLYSLPSRDLIADSVEYMVERARAPTRCCASPTATRSRPACSWPPCGSTSRPSSSPAARWKPGTSAGTHDARGQAAAASST